MRTLSEILESCTQDYLSSLNPINPPPPQEIEHQVLDAVSHAIAIENTVRDTPNRLPRLHELKCAQIADIMTHLYSVKRIAMNSVDTDPDYDIIGIYQAEGPDAGLYVTDEDSIRRIARQFKYSLSKRDTEEILIALRDKAPRAKRCLDRDLIPVNNGIFNYKTKELQPFTPDLVFLTKSRVDYNPDAKNITIHNDDDGTDWDVESWFHTLSDDPEIVQLLWEILGAIVRPNVRWNKSAWLYSDLGNNGKGTLCELMRNLCGPSSYASIPLASFSSDFMLEPLIRSSAIIVDENDVGLYIDQSANLKAVITNDVILINRKFKSPIAYQFFGFMVQCLNEFPRIKDKSDSFARRQLFVPMTKCFTGHERKYIKTDYIHRKEVLEYVLHKVLHTNYYVLSEPEACRAVLAEYRMYNDPIRQFYDEIVETQCTWDLLPFAFLYEVYKAWFRENIPNGSIQGRNKFIQDLTTLAASGDTWVCKDKNKRIRTANLMDRTEPLILRYNIDTWMNKSYRGDDPKKICRPELAESYRGLVRKTQLS